MGREQRRPQAPMGARVVEVVASDETLSPYGERFRLNNLSPQEGSRKNRKRKGRGYGAGQVCTQIYMYWSIIRPMMYL